MASPENNKLSANQKRFVEEYVIDRNGVQAYWRAFGRKTPRGVTRTYAGSREATSRLLSNPNVRLEIEDAARSHAKSCKVSAVKVLQILASAAFADRTEAFEPDADNGGLPKPRPLKEIPTQLRLLIEGIKIKRRRQRGEDGDVYEIEEIEYKFYSRDSAIDKLAKHLGLTKDGSALEKLLEALQQHQSGDRKDLPAESASGSTPAGDEVEPG